MSDQSYLGKGELHPFTPNNNGAVALIEGPALIKQSMFDVLETPRGTQFPNEEYGSLLYLLTFVPNDAVLKSLLVYFISEALFLWEKRIKVLDVTCESVNENTMNCYVQFRILASNEIDAFVYPFYKELKT